MPSIVPTRSKLGWFKGELLAGHTYKAALFTSAASFGAGTTGYTATNEATGGTGYTAGGQALAPTYSTDGTKAIIDYVDISWVITGGPFAFQYMMIYDDTDTVIPDMVVAVFDFGAQSTTDGTITIQFPTPDQANAILRLA